MKERRYTLVRESDKNEIVYVDYSKLSGFKFEPRKGLDYEGIRVNKLILIKPSFVEKILKRKIQIRLKMYLNYMISIMSEQGESDNPGRLQMVLDDLHRYEMLIKNKYRRYLDDKFYAILQKKVEMLEQELKAKMFSHRLYERENEKETGFSR